MGNAYITSRYETGTAMNTVKHHHLFILNTFTDYLQKCCMYYYYIILNLKFSVSHMRSVLYV